jgi:hypothetical protein
MTQELTCELNLALIPEETLANKHIALSAQLAKRYRAVIQLNGITPRLAFAPHLTLYQVPIEAQDLPELCAALAHLSARASLPSLDATEFRANEHEGSFEVRYAAAPELMQLQEDLIAAVNPLRRDLLLERDPAGHKLTDLITETGVAGDNIRRTGFDAVGDPARGGLFHPHVTINWFELGTSVELNGPDWPPLSDFNGRFLALGIFFLGPYGTCAQRMATLEISG